MKLDLDPESTPVPLILIVEDNLEIQASLALQFQRAKFSVQCFSQAEEALELTRTLPQNESILFLLDLNLAGTMNGFELTECLRNQPKTAKLPIILLTAESDSQNIVRGLNAGADDYVTKPFDFEVLLARVRTCLRRRDAHLSPVTPTKKKIKLGGIEIDPQAHEVHNDGELIHLTAFEYLLLLTLMSHPNELLSREDLLLRVLGGRKMVTGRTIDVHIRALRSKLGDNAKHIETIRGFGYRFTASEAGA